MSGRRAAPAFFRYASACRGFPSSGNRALTPIFQRERRYGVGESLERKRPNCFALESAVQSGHGLAVEEDLAGFGFAAEARGQVRDIADRRIVPAPFEADGAERRIALRDAHAERELEAALF